MYSSSYCGRARSAPTNGGISSLCSSRSDPQLEPNRDTATGTALSRPTTVAFVNCFDAPTYGHMVRRSPDEERRLRNMLAALRDYAELLRQVDRRRGVVAPDRGK
jgi:hypothetical protein